MNSMILIGLYQVNGHTTIAVALLTHTGAAWSRKDEREVGLSFFKKSTDLWYVYRGNEEDTVIINYRCI